MINVNVNVRHTYWAPLNPVTEALHAVELTLFLWHMPEGVAEHSFLGCSHQSTCMPSYSLYVQLLWNPIYYPGGMKARVSPVQWSEPHSILAPTQDSNPGGRIQNHKRWPLHYHCTPLTALSIENSHRAQLRTCFIIIMTSHEHVYSVVTYEKKMYFHFPANINVGLEICSTGFFFIYAACRLPMANGMWKRWIFTFPAQLP